MREAAQRLGLSERGVLKRIHAGTLRAERHGKRWVVFLPAEPRSEPSRTANRTSSEPTEPIEAEYRVVPAEQQAAVVNLVQQMIAPFVKELGETKEQLGRVTAERDALQARLSALEERHAESPTQASSAPQTATDAPPDMPWWAFWRRAD